MRLPHVQPPLCKGRGTALAVEGLLGMFKDEEGCFLFIDNPLSRAKARQLPLLKGAEFLSLLNQEIVSLCVLRLPNAQPPLCKGRGTALAVEGLL